MHSPLRLNDAEEFYLNLSRSHGVGLHEVQSVHGSGTQHQRPQVAHGAGHLGRQKYQIILQAPRKQCQIVRHLGREMRTVSAMKYNLMQHQQ